MVTVFQEITNEHVGELSVNKCTIILKEFMIFLSGLRALEM